MSRCERITRADTHYWHACWSGRTKKTELMGIVAVSSRAVDLEIVGYWCTCGCCCDKKGIVGMVYAHWLQGKNIGASSIAVVFLCLCTVSRSTPT